MDSDNPWDNPSPSPATPLETSPPTSPRLSYSPSADERPTWGAESPAEPPKTEEKQPEKEESEGEAEEDKAVTEPEEDGEKDASSEEDDAVSAKDEQGEDEVISEPEAAAEDNKSDDVAPPPSNDDEPAEAAAPSSPEPEAESAPEPEPEPELPSDSVSTLPSTLPDPSPNDGPPMDDFDDDFDEPAPAGEAAAEDGDDDFDDFGDAAGAGDGEGDDDFGDFGDFGDAAPLDASAFEAPAASSLPPPVPVVVPSASPAPPPTYPPLRLDLTNTARRAVAPQLKEFCKAVWTEAEESVNDDPERQVEGVGQVLVTESSRSLLANLSSLPQLRPLDWRRSKIRREHLVAMGIPVNLDDTAEPKYPSLALSRNRLGPITSSHSPTRSSSAPPLSGATLPFSSASASSLPGSRSSTPFADRERTRPGMSAPPLDKARAEELIAIREEDLTLMPLDKLRAMGDELERISVEASGVLTHALMMREKEGQDKEVYNGMIQDLVIAAAKMKTSSAGGTAVKRSGSGRWGR
ncbi:hypothetical protein JCM6882_003160 [Rhodosporidiobolus microsporus]